MGEEVQFIDIDNYQEDGVYRRMYEDFHIDDILKSQAGIAAMGTRTGVATSIDDERARCKAAMESISTEPDYAKLLIFQSILLAMHDGNLPPVILKEQIADRFFGCFPDGQICYVAHEAAGRHELIRICASLSKQYLGGYPHFPHDVGLSLDYALDSVGLDMPLHLTFPYIMGINAPLAFGNIVFMTSKPVPTWDLKHVSCSEMLMSGVCDIYTDNRTPSRGHRRPILVYPGIQLGDERTTFNNYEYRSYFEWYVGALAGMYNLVSKASSDEDAFLVSISISRILSESYAAVLSEVPLLRLILIFGILDKYANLSTSLGYSTGREPDMWMRMISSDNFKKNSEILSNIVGLGKHFADVNDAICGELAYLVDEQSLQKANPKIEPARLLRIYRNSYHGYLLLDPQDRKTIICHSGNIINEFADLAPLLWNAFVKDPISFLKL